MKLTRFEHEVMEAFWAKEGDPPLSIREVHERLGSRKPLAYTTVQTIVGRLEAKGALRRVRKVGNAHLFEPVVTRRSVQRRLVDVDYYISLGGYAYSRLASHDDAFADVFGELAEKFVPVVDVLSDISDRSRSSNRDVLRLYERWLRTGSERDRLLLAEKGLTAPGSRRIQ